MECETSHFFPLNTLRVFVLKDNQKFFYPQTYLLHRIEYFEIVLIKSKIK